MSSSQHPDNAGPDEHDDPVDGDAARAALLARFRGPVEESDAERVEFWRQASDAAHAKAMVELAEYAEMVVAHTGYGKDPDEMFPGFPMRAAARPPEATGDGG